MKRLTVNKDACIGCGLCNATNPDVFALDENNIAEVIADIDDAAADEVIASCPSAAIEE